MPTYVWPNAVTTDGQPIVKQAGTRQMVRIEKDDKKFKECLNEMDKGGDAYNFIRLMQSGEIPLDETTFKALPYTITCMVKPTGSEITGDRFTVIAAKVRPDPTKMQKLNRRAYENDKAAKHMAEREHCRRKVKRNNKQPWPYNMSFEDICYYDGTYYSEFDQCDFESKNGPQLKCKRKGYHKNMYKKQTGKRNGNNRQYNTPEKWREWKESHYQSDDDVNENSKEWEIQKYTQSLIRSNTADKKYARKKNQKRKNRQYAKCIASGKL